jgi:hypothetical protein
MRGFKSHDAADRFCRQHGELRNLLRPRRRYNQIVSASLRRSRFAKSAAIALKDVDLVRELPYGPAANERPHQRPDRCQHPTYTPFSSKDSPCACGGVHRCCKCRIGTCEIITAGDFRPHH